MQPTRSSDGTLLYDPDSITSSWRDYYADLHSPKSESWYDDDHHQHVLRTLSSLPDTCTYLRCDAAARIFTEEDIQRKCAKLKSRKAAGVDGITGENLRYGGAILHTALTILFNSITVQKIVPDRLKRAVIIPIPKGKNKDFTIKDNYRGVSLSPVITKVYKQLLSDWFDDDIGNFHHLQGAAQKHCSSVHSSLLLREVIQHNMHQGNTVYVTPCDARKAYDTVNYDGLFYKLYRMGCNNVLWQVLRHFYINFRSCVFIGNQRSPWFDVLLEVHQGAPLSMKMHMVFNNDLLDCLCSMAIGVGISGVDFPLVCPAFADDVAIVTLHKPLLQRLMQHVYKHSATWRYSFNPIKRHVLIFGKDQCPMKSVTLGESSICTLTADTHLGIPLATHTSLLDNAIQERVSSGRARLFCALSIGNKYTFNIRTIYGCNTLACRARHDKIVLS